MLNTNIRNYLVNNIIYDYIRLRLFMYRKNINRIMRLNNSEKLCYIIFKYIINIH